MLNIFGLIIITPIEHRKALKEIYYKGLKLGEEQGYKEGMRIEELLGKNKTAISGLAREAIDEAERIFRGY